MLVWTDIETDGLDARQNVILELGLVVTDDDLVEVARASWQLHYEIDDGPHGPPPNVLEMHAASGLLEECLASLLRDPDVAQMALNFLDDLGVPRGEVPLCGSSVHFDRAFLREWMPQLNSFFHYRIVDVSVLLELARRWRPELKRESELPKAHRALPDIERSIDLLRYYRQEMFR